MLLSSKGLYELEKFGSDITCLPYQILYIVRGNGYGMLVLLCSMDNDGSRRVACFSFSFASAIKICRCHLHCQGELIGRDDPVSESSTGEDVALGPPIVKNTALETTLFGIEPPGSSKSPSPNTPILFSSTELSVAASEFGFGFK